VYTNSVDLIYDTFKDNPSTTEQRVLLVKGKENPSNDINPN